MTNLQRGGGPQTATGKTRSSQNDVKHGITSNKMFVLQNKNPAAWAEMLDLCVEQFRPTTRYEYTIVEEIAFAKWRLRRLWVIENGLMDVEMDEQADAFEKKYEGGGEATRQTLAFKSLNQGPGASLLLSRYQVRLERSIERAAKSLRDLRAAAKAEAQPAFEPASEPVVAQAETPQRQNAKRTGPVLVSASTPANEAPVSVLQNELPEIQPLSPCGPPVEHVEHLDL